ncbi:hypothetical protein L2E82_09738 [Cichorium intybus]|uniref:Uncharacterized protein n=1 Tax=Cichorium intybus TaxID=13427 RepID=A0ACB9G9S4_CICIN|nr:hypothetical protein L2E82_09738 [Cichorium intybus]
MGGGAWPFLVGGAICLVNSVNERDLSLLTSYVEVCDALRCSGPHARYTDVFNEYIALADRPGKSLKFHRDGDRSLQLLVFNEEFLVSASHQLALTTSLPFVHTARRSYRLNGPVSVRIAATWAVRRRRRRENSTEPYHLEEGEVVTSQGYGPWPYRWHPVGLCLWVAPFGVPWILIRHNNKPRHDPVNHRVFERKCAQSHPAEGTPAWASRIASPPTMHPLSGHMASGRRLVSRAYGAPSLKIGQPGCPNCSLEKASSAADRAQVPWKGAPERVRAPSCRTLSHHEALSASRVVWECSPNRAVNSSKAKYRRETDSKQVPRGKDEKDFEKRVKECLKLSGGKRMGAGDASRSDVERR